MKQRTMAIVLFIAVLLFSVAVRAAETQSVDATTTVISSESEFNSAPQTTTNLPDVTPQPDPIWVRAYDRAFNWVMRKVYVGPFPAIGRGM